MRGKRGWFRFLVIVGIGGGMCAMANANGFAQANKEKFDKLTEVYVARNWDKTIELSKEYLKTDPNNVNVILRLAESYIEKNLLVLAEDTVHKALSIDPKNPWAIRVLARVYSQKAVTAKDEKEKSKYLQFAKAEIERALSYTPNDTWTNMDAAVIYLRLKDKTKALKCIDVSLRNEPKLKPLQGLKKEIEALK